MSKIIFALLIIVTIFGVSDSQIIRDTTDYRTIDFIPTPIVAPLDEVKETSNDDEEIHKPSFARTSNS